MAPGLPEVVLALLVAQSTGADTTGYRASQDTGAPVSREDPGSVSGSWSSRFTREIQSGAPLLPDVSPPPPDLVLRGGSFDVGVMSQLRALTLQTTTSSQGWGMDMEVTPGLGFDVNFASLQIGGGYAVRFTFPFNATGDDLAILQLAYLRFAWNMAARWTLSFTGNVTFGEFSDIVPIESPGASGTPPATLDPIRSFSTYPYLAALGRMVLSFEPSHRSRFRFSAGYSDIGGLGTLEEGQHPRTWGPSAEIAFDWALTPRGTLTSSVSFVDRRVVDAPAIAVGTWLEAWNHRWSDDLETSIAAGLALTSSESARFLGAGFVLPVTSVTLRYYTDVRHAFRLRVNGALTPYVDPYVEEQLTVVNSSYQRLSATLGLDWHPARNVFVGALLAAVLAPTGAPEPLTFGTAGLSASWAPWRWFTVSGGAFSQFQGTAQGSFNIAPFRQWTTYVSVSLSEHLPF